MIGIFDSGLGGLTVVREVQQLLPSASICYLADTVHIPYGERSLEEIQMYCQNNIDYLVEQGAHLIVVACFTASSVQLKASVPIVKIADSFLSCSFEHKRIALLGTQATIESGVLLKHLRKHCASSVFFPLACKTFVPLIESGNFLEAEALIEEYGTFMTEKKIDTVLLACSHYAYLLPLMKKHWSQVDIVNGAPICARSVAEYPLPFSENGEHRFLEQYQEGKFRRYLKEEAERVFV